MLTREELEELTDAEKLLLIIGRSEKCILEGQVCLHKEVVERLEKHLAELDKGKRK
ncbi:hypothetical protein [Seleniivibrio woodruffii]|uniref:Uncharacterized protein n=1 Tax=Seleniivibrio woodruffii TaxID=1078050 RepID=A0A4R1K8I0_9BACT|nr:hypothetical protein [Seleniivibrio woodruffii]TCK59429.1 hypothetical protein C8D98_2363 [Seleniivibrio woodruffii]TVZ35530.1 hypothetical protein OF66_1145 [Seleniivibrio woodruffii]